MTNMNEKKREDIKKCFDVSEFHVSNSTYFNLSIYTTTIVYHHNLNIRKALKIKGEHI